MPIILADNADFAAHVPVVVAGGGACGLVAALAAHDAGVSVVVIERDPLPRGSTSMSLGALCAVGSPIRRGTGLPTTPISSSPTSW